MGVSLRGRSRVSRTGEERRYCLRALMQPPHRSQLIVKHYSRWSDFNGLKLVALQAGPQRNEVTARLLVDCMGHYSPIVKQMRGSAKPQGMVLVVGTCAEGMPAERNRCVLGVGTQDSDDSSLRSSLQHEQRSPLMSVSQGTEDIAYACVVRVTLSLRPMHNIARIRSMIPSLRKLRGGIYLKPSVVMVAQSCPANCARHCTLPQPVPSHKRTPN